MEWPPKLPRGCPLTVNKGGYVAWINGKTRWVCGKKPVAEAIRIYHRKAAVIAGGDKPLVEAPKRPEGARATIHYILARWTADRRRDAEADDLRPATFLQYKRSAKRIDAVAGHWLTDEWGPSQTEDLFRQLGKKHGEDFAKRAIGHFATACRHAAERDWCRPVRFGASIVSKLTSRPAPQMKWKLYDRTAIRKILAAAIRDVRNAGRKERVRDSAEQLLAMILLALNGGMGSQELSDLRRESVDLDRAVIGQPRGKTGARHIVPLWAETVDALRPVLARRKGDELVFRTNQGNPWCRQTGVVEKGKLSRVTGGDNVNYRFKILVKRLGMNSAGIGFYKCKHIHSGLADAAGDSHATFVLAGHKLPGARGYYVDVSEDRVRKVTEYIRHELLLPKSKTSSK